MLFAAISKDMYRGKTRNNAKQACGERKGQTGGANVRSETGRYNNRNAIKKTSPFLNLGSFI